MKLMYLMMMRMIRINMIINSMKTVVHTIIKSIMIALLNMKLIQSL